MILVREIPSSEITQSELFCLAEVGFVVKERGSVIEIWVEEMAAV